MTENEKPPVAGSARSSQRVTLKRIAELAGVHPATVSRALDPEKSTMISEETRARVIEMAAELDYQPNIPARTLRHGRSATMGVVVADLENPYTGRMVRGIENALEGRGIMALIAETQDDVDRMGRVLSHLISRSVDAIITTAARRGTERVLKKAFYQVPLVLADRSLQGAGFPTVAPDDVLGGRLAAEHLLSLGHTRLAQLSGPDDISSFERRSAGFRSAIEAAGAELIDPGENAREPSVAEGRRLATHMIESGKAPTGIFAQNDLMALGALDALNELGFACPEEMSIVGYDDLPLTAYTSPPLTTVRLPGYHLGRMAAEVAVSLSEDPHAEASDLTIAPTLVIRMSSAPPHVRAMKPAKAFS
ncbi:MAG TPA: LacI family DNA-binding transcriptional regulator [Acidimicrobiia bacterium]|nr:LacI family DNA-binding transcriptional regulator [Acidimicrobiia bacterium]